MGVFVLIPPRQHDTKLAPGFVSLIAVFSIRMIESTLLLRQSLPYRFRVVYNWRYRGISLPGIPVRVEIIIEMNRVYRVTTYHVFYHTLTYCCTSLFPGSKVLAVSHRLKPFGVDTGDAGLGADERC